ncbi:MAG: acyltransferase [Bacteroidaceae bacterium]|nr:acyltransferase [Bacteroidaceae bacterium]
MSFTQKIKESRLKPFLLWMMINPVETRPRTWLRLLRPLFTRCAWSSVIHFNSRMDVVPFNRFVLGKRSIVESFSCVNNAVGDVLIGDCSRVGLNNTIIGPVCIGSHVNLAQGVVVSGLNHGFYDSSKRIDEQKVKTSQIVIEDDVWIGANCVITAGVHIGEHSVIGAGSVVTKDIPPHSLAVGSPAKVIKSI